MLKQRGLSESAGMRTQDMWSKMTIHEALINESGTTQASFSSLLRSLD
jgi:hypothetical protein